jgi:predicted ATPase
LEIMLTFKREQIEHLFQIFGRERSETTTALAAIDRYLREVNRFLRESGKDLVFSDESYELGFTIPSLQPSPNPALSTKAAPSVRPLKELSSGERQIMIVLTFLAFLAGDNSIFVIDEPELSLHIRWQSYLIEALQNLRPDGCQIVIATHAPEIAGRAREFARILKPSYLPDGDSTSDNP